MKSKRGFSLYLTFLVTTVVFILVSSSQTLARFSIYNGKASLAECIVYHAADGGLERGLNKLRQKYAPFVFSYYDELTNNRKVETTITAIKEDNDTIKLLSKSCLYESEKLIASRQLARFEIKDEFGRKGIGLFAEVK